MEIDEKIKSASLKSEFLFLKSFPSTFPEISDRQPATDALNYERQFFIWKLLFGKKCLRENFFLKH